LDTFKVIAFTHKNFPLQLIGKLHIPQDEQSPVLQAIKIHYDLEELFFLSTCNRVELFLKGNVEIKTSVIQDLVLKLNASLTPAEADALTEGAEVFEGPSGVEHLLKVASSLDSMVVGEREIITQVRKAYDFCNEEGLTGDFIRLLIRQTIETAKDIYTNTDIARNPVSVASLAYRQLRNLGVRNDARIVFVGSGETNTILASYFKKHKFANFTVFNRTVENACKLATHLNGQFFKLDELADFKNGFDVLVVCTASKEPIITGEIYKNLTTGDHGKKVIIDLGVPANVESVVARSQHVNYIDIKSLKLQAEVNMQLRKNEIEKCEEIISRKAAQFSDLYEERRIELAFGDVPKQVKAIRELAVNEVFAREISSLDVNGREVLNKVLAYMEKKYNAVAIKKAKEVFTAVKD
jgi:glutamyl-tRNA reductase